MQAVNLRRLLRTALITAILVTATESLDAQDWHTDYNKFVDEIEPYLRRGDSTSLFFLLVIYGNSTVTWEGDLVSATPSSSGVDIVVRMSPRSFVNAGGVSLPWGPVSMTSSPPDSDAWLRAAVGTRVRFRTKTSGSVITTPAGCTPPCNPSVATNGSAQLLSDKTPSSAGLKFVPMEPCRLMETRSEYNFQGRSGAFGPPFLNRGETRTLPVPQSNVCSVPTTAKAFVVNVILIPRSAGVDFITLWPAGDSRPTFWTVRSPDGQTVANSAIVQAGASGGISVYASDSTDLVIDINGYFTDNANTPGYSYFPLVPCRVADTRIAYRSSPGPFGPPTMNGGERRSFGFPAASQYCQVPVGAKAYAVTITVAPPGPLQFLTAWPTGSSQPNVSTINSPLGRTLANSVIVPASNTGSIDGFVFDRSDVLIDITGYFAPDSGQGLLYYPITQCRPHNSQFADEQVKTITLAGSACSNIPATALAYAANVTSISGGSPMPFLTIFPTGQSRPNVSTLNAFEGQTATNSAIVPSGPGGAIDIFAYRHTQVVLEISGYFAR